MVTRAERAEIIKRKLVFLRKEQDKLTRQLKKLRGYELAKTPGKLKGMQLTVFNIINASAIGMNMSEILEEAYYYDPSTPAVTIRVAVSRLLKKGLLLTSGEPKKGCIYFVNHARRDRV